MGSNPSGSRPNFFGRQHLTFDKGGKDMVRIGNNPSGSRPILLGDSTSPLTREASLARGEAVDVPLRRLWGLRGSVGVKQSLR